MLNRSFCRLSAARWFRRASCFSWIKGFEAQVRPRSGLALKHGVTVLNTPGTVDADYRGEVKVMLVNLGSEPFTVTRGHAHCPDGGRARARQVGIAAVESVDETARGGGGFGSTGLSRNRPR